MIDFKWANPFADKQIDNFISLCGAEKTFQMKEYLLGNISEEAPFGLAAFQTALKEVFSRSRIPWQLGRYRPSRIRPQPLADGICRPAHQGTRMD